MSPSSVVPVNNAQVLGWPGTQMVSLGIVVGVQLPATPEPEPFLYEPISELSCGSLAWRKASAVQTPFHGWYRPSPGLTAPAPASAAASAVDLLIVAFVAGDAEVEDEAGSDEHGGQAERHQDRHRAALLARAAAGAARRDGAPASH